MDNIFFFTGSQKYFLQLEINRRIKGFEQKENTKANVLKNFSKSQLDENLFSGDLFGGKKLVFLYGIPRDTDPENKIDTSLEDYFFSSKNYIGEDIILVLVSFQPDKRGKIFKRIEQNNIKTYDFSKLTAKEWDKLFEGYDISKEVRKLLIDKLSDPYRVENELKKYEGKIGFEDLENIYSTQEINNFALFDNLIFSEGYKKLDLDIEPFQFFGGLMWALRNTILALDAKKNNISLEAVSKNAGIQSWQLQKSFKSGLDYEKTILLYKNLLELDNKIKTGKISSDLMMSNIQNIFYEFSQNDK